jgi:hypothetical protein
MVSLQHKEQLLSSVLEFLGQTPPVNLAQYSIHDIWQWALVNWDIACVPSKLHIQPVLSQYN